MTIDPPKTDLVSRINFLDVKDVAEKLKVSEDTVYNLFTTGDLPGRKVGRKWTTTEKIFADWFENTSIHSTPRRYVKNDIPDDAASSPPRASVKPKVAARKVTP